MHVQEGRFDGLFPGTDGKDSAMAEGNRRLANNLARVARLSGLAFASFQLYEKQFLKLKRYFPEARAASM
jgi:hypothetical protein